MIGVAEVAVYVPRWRLQLDVIARAWGTRGGAGERSVAGPDEDALTLAVAAARQLDAPEVAGIVFASTTAPLADGDCAPIAAAALDLASSVRTRDLVSARGALAGLVDAAQALEARGEHARLVLAGECQLGEPGEALEHSLADAGAAVLVRRDDPGDRLLAELLGSGASYDETLHRWRESADPYLHSEENRYALERLAACHADAVRGACVEASMEPSALAAVVLATPSRRLPAEVARRLELPTERVVAVDGRGLGSAGAVDGAVALAQSLAGRSAGEKVAVSAEGRGATACVLRTTARAATWRPVGLDETLAAGRPLSGYSRYLRWRGLIGQPAQRPAVTNVVLGQDAPAIVRFRGGRCEACEQVSYPRQRVCVRCRAGDRMADTPLAHRGRIFTYTVDHLTTAAFDRPIGMAVVALDDGARLLMQVTDVDVTTLAVEQPVETVFRRIHTGGSRPNYGWKCRPSAGERSAS